jgi:hypothetical protein
MVLDRVGVTKPHGRIVKTTGDGMLVEFASVVDAVRCAVEVQQAMPERNTGFGADHRIELRIGINLGDVIVEGDDLYGDGVNIAARIEALADAGGVFVSNTIRDHVRDRLPFVFEDLGEQQVKNIARPVRVYRVRDANSSSGPTPPALPLPDKPSIAVLPFANMSGDPEQEYFAFRMVVVQHSISECSGVVLDGQPAMSVPVVAPHVQIVLRVHRLGRRAGAQHERICAKASHVAP